MITGTDFHAYALGMAEQRTLRALVRRALTHGEVTAEHDRGSGLYVVRAGMFAERFPFPLSAARRFIELAGGALPPHVNGYRRVNA